MPDVTDTPIPKLVPAKAVAEAFSIGESRVRTLAREGKIPSYAVGGAIRFNFAEVLEATKRHREGEDDEK